MRILDGKQEQDLDAEALWEERRGYDHCLVDVGTGDGRFVLRHAKEHPDTFCLGIDAVADAMRKEAVRARRKPTRGGAANARFLVAAAEDLPGPLPGIADLLTVNFPWGSLQRILVEPVEPQLRRLAALAVPGARVVILLNASVFDDYDYRDRLALPPLDAERARRELVPVYARAGIAIEEVTELAGEIPHRTSWGQRLVRGSSRSMLMLAGRRVGDLKAPPGG